jgi:hypothetical protein
MGMYKVMFPLQHTPPIAWDAPQIVEPRPAPIDEKDIDLDARFPQGFDLFPDKDTEGRLLLGGIHVSDDEYLHGVKAASSPGRAESCGKRSKRKDAAPDHLA